MPIASLPSGDIHYTESGQGSAIVLLHGNPGDSQDFASVIPVLARLYRVIALDWPGYGQSPLPRPGKRLGATLFYEVLREFVEHSELSSSLFIGNSVGGNAAARLAIASPSRVRGLILVSPGGFTNHNAFTRGFCRLQASRFSISPSRLARRYLKHRTPVTAQMIERAATLHASEARLTVNRTLWRSFLEPEYDLRETAKWIAAPTFFIFGKRDPLIPAKKDGAHAAKALPQAQTISMDCGHVAFAELPSEFLKSALPFLERCPKRAEDQLAWAAHAEIN